MHDPTRPRLALKSLVAPLLLAGALVAPTPSVAVASPGWTVQPSPNVGNGPNALHGVAATSATNAWAVGFYINGPLRQTLIERWNGEAWEVQPSPNVGNMANQLEGVAATSATNAWAVGHYFNGISEQTLIEHWDGTAWSVQPSPNVGLNSLLYGVTATSATNAWAVGKFNYNGMPSQTLIVHWDGTAWSVQPSPNPGIYSNVLNGVAATSATNAWAVGHSFDGFGTTDQTLIQHWNGTVWTVQPSPNVPHTNNDLSGVAATSGTDAWAVGHFFNWTASGFVDQTLIEHWNGTAWTVQPSPSPGIFSVLNGVAATSGTNAWAVGYFSDRISTQTLVERWDGAAWTVEPSPNVGSFPNALAGVAATSGTDAWAVGVFDNYKATGSQAERTLIEHCC